MSCTHCPGRAVAGGWFLTSLFLLTMLAGCDDSRAQGRSAGGSDAAAEPAPQGFNGVFHASIDGHDSMIHLSERDGRVSGMVGAAVIAAQTDGSRASGAVKDPRTGATVGAVEMSLQGARLEVAITIINPESGHRHAMPAVAYTRGTAPPVDVTLDGQIVGRWRHSWTAGSGDEPAVVTTWLILSPDGSIEQGRSSGGSADALLMLSSSGDDGISGRWRTQQRVLHVLPAGKTHWIALAQYEVIDEQLRLTYNNGSRQVFSRQ